MKNDITTEYYNGSSWQTVTTAERPVYYATDLSETLDTGNFVIENDTELAVTPATPFRISVQDNDANENMTIEFVVGTIAADVSRTT